MYLLSLRHVKKHCELVEVFLLVSTTLCS